MDKIIATLIGGETKMIPIKVMSVSHKVACYIDSQVVEEKRETPGSTRESLLNSQYLWGYKVRMEAIKRRRTIRNYLFLINNAF